MKTAAILLLFLPLVFELVQDYVQIKYGKGDEKDRGKGWVDWVYRIIGLLIAMSVNGLAGFTWWAAGLLTVAVFFAGFNYGLNALRGKPIFHLGQDAWDRFEAINFPGWRGVIVRALVLGGAIAFYCV
jgi:hypothetical protein